MSSQLRRTRRKTKKSSTRTPGSSRKSTSSETFLFESECINSSASSVFLDNDESVRKTKRKTRRKKLHQLEVSENMLKRSESADSVSDQGEFSKASFLELKQSKKTKKKLPVTLPDSIFFSETDNDQITDDQFVKKKGEKKKIRHTEDLNFLDNKKEDSDKRKVKSKKTKRARLPSFLPPVEVKKDEKLSSTKSTESSATDSDKDNDTTDTEKWVKKTKKGRSKKNMTKTTKNKKSKVTDMNEAGMENTNETERENDMMENSPLKISPVLSRSYAPSKTPKSPALSKTSSLDVEIYNGKSVANENNCPVRVMARASSQKRVTKNALQVSSPQVIDTTKMDIISVNESSIENSPQREKSPACRKILKSLKRNNGSVSNENTDDDLDVDIISEKCIDNKNSSVIIVNQPTPGRQNGKRKTFDVSSPPFIDDFRRSENNETLTSKRRSKQNTVNLSHSQIADTTNEIHQASNNENSSKNYYSHYYQKSDKSDNSSAKKAVKRNTFDKITENSSVIIVNQPSSGPKNRKRNSSNISSSQIIYDLKMDVTFDEQKSKEMIETLSSTVRKSSRKNMFDRTPKIQNTSFKNEKYNRSTVTRSASVDLNTIDKVSGSDNEKSQSSSRTASSPRKSTRATKTTCPTPNVGEFQTKTPTLKREGTFEISSTRPEFLFQQNMTNTCDSGRETYDVVPMSRNTKFRSSKASSSGKGEVTVVDLTESVTEIKGESSSAEARVSGNSSFDFSFKVKRGENTSEKILDHLNITRRDSRKSSLKKTSAGMKLSSTDDDVSPIRSFVTLRRGCHTMTDFDTGSPEKASCHRKSGFKKLKNCENLAKNISGDMSVISNKSSPEAAEPSVVTTESEKLIDRKCILKKPHQERIGRSFKRDTFECAELYYENIESIKKCVQAKVSVPVANEVTPTVFLEPKDRRDIFDIVSATPTSELGKMMIGSGESIIVPPSFLGDTTNLSVIPRMTRASALDRNDDASESPTRKSTRKRWSQVERTPIFGKLPPDSPLATNDTTNTSINNTKSVSFRISPRKSRATSLRSKVMEKGMKSVKIESPSKTPQTPKMRLHSPLIIRKTPKPNFGVAKNSIISGNCAFKPSKVHTPPSGTSTPYNTKKETGLLKNVLTGGKNKSGKNEKSAIKNTSRTKMPNFTKIHQRQFEKMENLKEMQERKAMRAQFLLSGNKPPPNTSVPENTERESRKQLMFSPVKVDTSTASKIATKTSTLKPLSKPLQHMLNRRASLEKQKKEMKSKVPDSIPKPVVIKERLPKTEQKGFTRFGFKLAPGKENLTKEDQIKAVTAKTKLPVDRTKKNRNQIEGVRSNRRFELLMKMRQNKK